MISLDTGTALAVLVAICGALGSFFAVKFGGAETQRLVKALHSRFDKLESEVQRIDKEHVRLDERVKAMKQTAKFRFHASTTLPGGEVPMFADGGGGDE
jgi:hypothetical protein